VAATAPKASYTRDEVRRLLEVTERQLRGWEQHQLIRPAQDFTWQDLIAIRTLAKLRQSRIPPTRIRAAVTALRKRLRDLDDPLREVKVIADGKRIRVEIGTQHMEPVSGQLLFNFDAGEIRRLLSFPGDSKRGAEEQRNRREAAEHWFQRGLELEQSGNVQEAISAYQKAVDLDCTSAGAWLNLGTIYFNARQWQRAETFYNKALEADPKYALAHFNLGNLHDERGRPERALKHYLEAVELRPDYADVHYNLALLYQSRSRTMDAVRHWKLYLKLDPGSTWAEIARRELGKLRSSTIVQGSRRSQAAEQGAC
jgi:tetratricopeptide (TPR) repeat protein